MDIILQKSVVKNCSSEIIITGSKSESNRLLLLQALFPEILIENLSNSDDTLVMQTALRSTSEVIDVHHAGTAMRFLTAFFATTSRRDVTLTGSSRMTERPIRVLVDALNALGADISYLKSEGFPPLKIRGKALTENKVSLKATISSQYISALILIAPKLKNGLELTLEGKITSVPYINMTLDLLHQIGVNTAFVGQNITIQPKTESLQPQTIRVESDWSSASYFYSIVALSSVGTELQLASYKQNSLQGDSVVVEIYKSFGVTTRFVNQSLVLQKTSIVYRPMSFEYDLSNAPDIAQTLAVTCFGLGIACYLTGLHTLKIKETDRLLALKTELETLGAQLSITKDSLLLQAHNLFISEETVLPLTSIATYNDHRMAMAFAPLALKTALQIEDAMVVSKSYPTFWDDLKSIGFKISE